MTAVPTYVYVTYIKASPEQVWHALTDVDLTAAYWGHRNESDWQPGSTWQHLRTDGLKRSSLVHGHLFRHDADEPVAAARCNEREPQHFKERPAQQQ